MLLGSDARVGARRVQKRHERKLVALGDLHDPHAFAIALGVRHAEVAPRALVDVAPLLLADDRDRLPLEAAEAGHESGILGPGAITVELDEVLEEALDVVERV